MTQIEAVAPELERGVVEELCSRLERDYFTICSVDDVARHVRLSQALGAEKPAVTAVKTRSNKEQSFRSRR